MAGRRVNRAAPGPGPTRRAADTARACGLPAMCPAAARAGRWPPRRSPSRRARSGRHLPATATREPYTRESPAGLRGPPARRPSLRQRRASGPRRRAMNSASRLANGASSNSGRGTTTMSRPAAGLCRRKSSRMSRFARLRRTADPSFRVAAIPSRARGWSDAPTNRVIKRPRRRPPASYTRRNSRRFRRRSGRPNRWPAGTYPSSDTVRRFRPFARRRLSTSRPFFVRIRTRNPCVLRRRRVLGW